MDVIGKVTKIIIHHSQRAKDHPLYIKYRHMHKRGWDDIGYHFVIGNGSMLTKDGEIYAGREESFAGAHAFGHNRDSIGICLIGDFDHEVPTRKQLESLVRLVKEKMRTYGVKASDVLGHRELPNVVKTCPGKNFDMDRLRSVLALEADQVVKARH